MTLFLPFFIGCNSSVNIWESHSTLAFANFKYLLSTLYFDVFAPFSGPVLIILQDQIWICFYFIILYFGGNWVFQICITAQSFGQFGQIWSVFIYELSCCRFKSCCSHLNFRYCACFEQGVPWHSGKYGVWIHCEMRTWHDKNIQSNALYRYVLTTQLNHLVSLAKWLSVQLWTKWLWVWIP